ncbi:pilus assembly protein [Acidimicrobiales bacterium]|nr:pilus assembly protein [Acidimicrobiales bacterium]
MKRHGERGQATVEFALIIPLVLVVLLVVIQVAVVAYAQLGVTHIARETARAVSVDPSTDLGLLAQNVATLGSDAPVIEVEFTTTSLPGAGFVIVTVHYETPPISRLFGPFANQLAVSAQVKMLMES